MMAPELDVDAYVRRLSRDELAIFLFHGVVDGHREGVRNYTRKHLERDDFEKLVRTLADRGVALSMDDVLARLRGGGAFPSGAYAITFDDGFANNLEVAAPVLEASATPATFYVTTRFVAENRMSWIDRIEYAVNATSIGSASLPDGSSVSFDDATSKVATLDRVRATVKTSPDLDVDRFVESFCAQLGARPVDHLDGPLDRKLTWPEVSALASHELFTVGGHSRTHAILSFLDDARLADEVDGSLADLERHAGVPAHHFSYPEGLAHCYSPYVVDRVRDAGVEICPTAIDGTNRPGADPFHLRRINVA